MLYKDIEACYKTIKLNHIEKRSSDWLTVLLIYLLNYHKCGYTS